MMKINEKRQNQTINKNKKDLVNILEDLNNNLSSYKKLYKNNLNNLISFFENISLVLESLPSKIIFHKIESSPLFNNNPSIYIIKNFYIFQKNLINNLLKFSENIKQNIIPKLNDYKNSLKDENNDISCFIEDTIKKININQQKIMEANKQNKIESEKLTKLELDSLKKLNNTAMLGLIHKTLDEQRKKVSNYSLIQQQEIQALNKLYSESQEEMLKKIYQLKSNYKNNNYIVLECIKNYLKNWNDDITEYNIFESKKIIEKIDFEEENQNPDNFIDLILMNDNSKTIFYNKWKFNIFNLENFNEDEEDENASHILQKYEIPLTNIKYDPEYMLILENIDSFKKQNEKSKIPKAFDPEFLYNFFLSLRKNKNILNTQLSEVVNLLEHNTGEINFYKEFCDNYISTNIKKIFSLYEFINFTNLAHLKSFINNILENIFIYLNDKNIDSFSLLDKIIIIGEKSFYDNTYLCSLLNKNKVFNNKGIWEDCIKFKIIDILNEICNQSNPNNNVINDGINKLYNKSTQFIGGIGGILGFESKKINKKENIIEYLGLNKFLPKYNDLPEDKKIILNKNQAPFIINEVFKIYIKHMANYSYSLENSINVIYDIYNYYQFNDNNIINYYLTYNNICYYSRKNKIQNFDLNYKKEKNKEKIKEKIKNIKAKQNKSFKYPIRLRNEKSKIILLKKIFIFLDDKDKIKLISLSKEVKKIISEKIYKYILRKKNTPVKRHIEIWKIYLNYIILKHNKKNIFNNLKSQIEKPEIREKNLKIFKVIEVDVKRTEFLIDKQKGKIAINNILKSLQLYNLENNYCQGMNYIVAFLYEIICDEEETFYIILSLFTNKNFSNIFKNEMAQLKNYFIIMEKLIHLFLPKIFYHFKKNQIMPEFFLSPFFITLFTHIYPSVQEKNNIFILRIWDEFIINGWKSIFEAILTILKIKEKNILTYQGDELVDFLVNKIDRDQLYLNKNYEKYEHMKNFFIISNELIRNLEEEILLENKIKN